MKFDVAIIGGGPAGSTLAGLLRKYAPELSVGIFERATFPREHVGESQLPLIGEVLHELGVWDKIEAAGFPIKIGATYRWGRTDDLWDFEFLAGDTFRSGRRPGKYEGQRRQTAFQVERSIYDDILLRHAQSLGAEVFMPCSVRRVEHLNSAIHHLETDLGQVEARAYVDASGNAAVLRRGLNVPVHEPSRLKNVAFWTYWDDAEWSVVIDVEATRVNVMSLGYGWIWFIPISKRRVSIGLVVPAEYYKSTGLRPEELYYRSLADEPLISRLTANAQPESTVHATKDWSFVAERLVGPNWYLVGESAGFADPILAAGLTLTHVGARDLACVLRAGLTGQDDLAWLAGHYEHLQQRRVRQHIRFADYWYSANAHFSELKEFVSSLAEEAGLSLSPDQAFQWLGTGGFANDDWRVARVATFSLAATRQLTQHFGGAPAEWQLSRYSHVRRSAAAGEPETIPAFHMGQVLRRPALRRGDAVLPLVGAYAKWADFLATERAAPECLAMIESSFPTPAARQNALEVLEAMIIDGWVEGRKETNGPTFAIEVPEDSEVLHKNRDLQIPATA
jgi:flavin-dependent dehydrogenase